MSGCTFVLLSGPCRPFEAPKGHRCTLGNLGGGKGGKEAAPPPSLSPCLREDRSEGAPSPWASDTLVQANPFVLWASVSSLRPSPCPTYLERCYANKRHCNELLGTWTPFSRKEASGSPIKLLRHVECTMIYPNGQMLPDEMWSFTSSQQHFTAGEPASWFPVFPERTGTFA